MPPETPKWLDDIRDAATYIVSVTTGVPFDRFAADRTLRQAVERNFEIIGEALSRISRSDPATVERLTDYRRIISFRNILIHGYDSIDVEIVWDVIQQGLPKLLADVETLLRGLYPP